VVRGAQLSWALTSCALAARTSAARKLGKDTCKVRRPKKRLGLGCGFSECLDSGSTPINRLQDAVADSGKDALREATTLNALKQRFYERGEEAPALKVQRFQNMADRPFKRISGAATRGTICPLPILGGLHHHYVRL
jgi:hypothetical protein